MSHPGRSGVLVRLWPRPLRALGRVRIDGRQVRGFAWAPPGPGSRVAVVGGVHLLGEVESLKRYGPAFTITLRPDAAPAPGAAGSAAPIRPFPPPAARAAQEAAPSRPGAGPGAGPPGDRFAEGMALYAAGQYGAAEARFLEEARSEEGRHPQRAAIAYRQAALAAARLGNADHFDHWMRLAGREYLKASEDPDAPARQVRESALLAARCFLEVENLDLSTKSLSRAQAVDLVLTEPVFLGTPDEEEPAPVPPRITRPEPPRERL